MILKQKPGVKIKKRFPPSSKPAKETLLLHLDSPNHQSNQTSLAASQNQCYLTAVVNMEVDR